MRDYRIPFDKMKVDYFIDHFCMPFSYLFLLLYKLEKAMLAAPKEGSEKNANQHEGQPNQSGVKPG